MNAVQTPHPRFNWTPLVGISTDSMCNTQKNVFYTLAFSIDPNKREKGVLNCWGGRDD